MKKIYLVCCLALSSLVSHAQTTVGYTYDAAGNRVNRTILLPSPSGGQKIPPSSKDRMYSDRILENTVKIYPNPTDGELKVSIAELKSTDSGSITVYTTQGTQILQTNQISSEVVINLYDQPSGMYLLKITINNNSTTWKIIKK